MYVDDSNNNAAAPIDTFTPDLNAKLAEIEEGHYLFIVADQKKATLLLFKNGSVEATRDIMDPSVNKKVKSDSRESLWRHSKLDHKIDNQIHKHFQLIAREATALLSRKHINGVFIGGHQTSFNAIKKELTRDLQDKVRADFVTELNIPREELIQHCKITLTAYLNQ